jgi:magnesium-transporting ATPase (P-type)
MMSVIAVEMETKDVYLFAKGAPEKINNICFNSPVDF